MMMNIKQLSIFLPLFFVSLVSCENTTSDFDLLCGYFDALGKHNSQQEMTADDKFKFINGLVSENLIEESAARISFNAIVGYVPVDGRYALYKSTTEEVLGKSWQCDSMEALLQDL